ncbi:zinc-dependent metalloprotease [Flavobacterium sp. TSSA_36]|uniref:zinc-dependent metalloprotease n=1 Tax=Flavobacterium sp. TSSA_36 TaxID=3447669 RepID=UPI003F39344B
MRKIPILLLLFFVFTSSYSQEKPTWKVAEAFSETRQNIDAQERSYDGFFELNWSQWRMNLDLKVPQSSKIGLQKITLPNASGQMEQFQIVENSNFAPELQAQFPEIRSFSGKGITDPNATVYFSMSPDGLQTMVLRNGRESEFLEPLKGHNEKYVLYRSDKTSKTNLGLKCETETQALAAKFSSKTLKSKASDRVFRTLRLALSCTGEYATYHGGTVSGALAAMNATLTRVNGIFNKDLALKLVLVADNNKVVFTDATTDPYATVVGGNAPSAWSQQLENTLTNPAILGADKYDIGHLFGASGGGGNAGCIGCVCNADKARAYTSPSNNKPEGDTFDLDFVAHEFGHQLGATHTFSHEVEGTGTNVEPGSGSTIMGYAGITDDYDVQKNSDDYFAYASIKQIQDNMMTKTCPVATTIDTAAFGVDAGSSYTIPKSTPFVLKGVATGATKNSFTYVWEQNDTAINAFGANSFAIADKVDGPLFRSIPPSLSLERYFPAYEKVLVNRLNSDWESVANIGRTLTFVLTARDNEGLGQTASDETQITVANTVGPFEVTSQNTVDLSWNPGSTQTITWNVNDTNTLLGASNVSIKLSTDGGLTFPNTLLVNTPNDGSETIVVPMVAAPKCRIKIEPTNSVFYALNKMPFAIGYTTVSSCNTYTFTTPIAIPDGVATYTIKEVDVPTGLGEVTDINVEVTLTHSYLSDVELEIVSPQNKTVRLLQRICGGTNATLRLKLDDSGVIVNCVNTSQQTITPTDLLSGFNGSDPAGKWLLRVRDAYPDDSGAISAAAMVICATKATLGTEFTQVDDVLIAPNPSNGIVNLQFTSINKGQVMVAVTDVLGRAIYQKTFDNDGDFNKTIDLTNALSGVYFLNIRAGDRKWVKKIIIK